MSDAKSLDERVVQLINQQVEPLRAEIEELRAARDEQYLTIKNASLRFDIPEDTLRKWVQRRQLRKYKIRGCVRVRVSEIIANNEAVE